MFFSVEVKPLDRRYQALPDNEHKKTSPIIIVEQGGEPVQNRFFWIFLKKKNQKITEKLFTGKLFRLPFATRDRRYK